MQFFKVAKNVDEACENWLIGFGRDEDGNDYYITTNYVHASEFHEVSGGAKFDAELICRLLNGQYRDELTK